MARKFAIALLVLALTGGLCLATGITAKAPAGGAQQAGLTGKIRPCKKLSGRGCQKPSGPGKGHCQTEDAGDRRPQGPGGQE